MIATASHMVTKFTHTWRRHLWLEILLLSMGVLIGSYVAFSHVWLTIILGLMSFMLLALWKKPWRLTGKEVSRYLDEHHSALEHSTSLLMVPSQQLSGIARLQQRKTANTLASVIKEIRPETHLLRAAGIAVIIIVVGSLIGIMTNQEAIIPSEFSSPADKITFVATDSLSPEQQPPELISQLVSVRYPAYANRKGYSTEKMDLQVLVNSTVSWKILFSSEVDSVFLESSGNSRNMKRTEDGYVGSTVIKTSGFYNFRFIDRNGNSYVSKLYAIEAIEDEAPSVAIEGIKQYTTFEHFDSPKQLTFNTVLTDDYGIADAYIVATVSKGEGESVKFREEKILFSSGWQAGNRTATLVKSLDLDALKMEVGEELYFHVETFDLKRPIPNKSRSETYFAMIKDTTQLGSGVEGGMAADLMPDYFRSQRQLIIDTEKLIADRGKIAKNEFNTTSNALGFDQKSLRLKYGQFMGDEADSALDIDHDHEEPEPANNEDPLAEYTHDHDGDNEHNLVAEEEEEYDHEHEEEDENNPLSQFIHDHGDPEAATLFSNSLKGKLRQAMNYMWDAELYLRLYQPEKSLPFQYKALKLIQEIKNSARIYVHRIGFDPPPVKESTRLTGDLNDVSSYRKTSDIGEEDPFKNMRIAAARLEELLDASSGLNNQDRILFKEAGQELAVIAIDQPITYLPALQALQMLSETNLVQRETLFIAQQGVIKAIPNRVSSDGTRAQFYGTLDQLLLKELEIND